MAASHELADRAAAVCRRPLPAKALREELVALVRRAVPSGGYNFPLTDPVTRVGTSPLADVPGLCWPRLPALIRSRYLTRYCRWDRMLEAGVTVTSLMRETGGHPGRSLLWRDVQSQLGVSDTAIVVFADRHGCWGLLDLWRYGGGSFQAGELRLLATLARPVTAGLRAAIARSPHPPAPPHPRTRHAVTGASGCAAVARGPHRRGARRRSATVRHPATICPVGRYATVPAGPLSTEIAPLPSEPEASPGVPASLSSTNSTCVAVVPRFSPA